jgi:predicted transcriptional regulator
MVQANGQVICRYDLVALGERIMLPIDSRRSSIHLMSEILRLLRLGDVGKTEVMYAVRLSYYQTQNYLRRLLELGLIQQAATDNHNSGYRITQKGLGLLGKLEQLQEQLQGQEIPQIFDSPELKVDEKPYGGTFRRIRDAIWHQTT